MNDDYYDRELPLQVQRTREHRCGRCAWQGTGSTACRNYVRAAPDPLPAIIPDDEEPVPA